MNIFYLSDDPLIAALYHCDQHFKMIVEYAQILSTAHRVLDGAEHTVLVNRRRIKRWKLSNKELDEKLYLATHVNHPSVLWARENYIQYKFLYDLFIELSAVYRRAKNKDHGSYIALHEQLENIPKNINIRGVFKEPPLCMPEDCRIGSAIDSYREFYIKEKSRFATWKDRAIPYWYTL